MKHRPTLRSAANSRVSGATLGAPMFIGLMFALGGSTAGEELFCGQRCEEAPAVSNARLIEAVRRAAERGEPAARQGRSEPEWPCFAPGSGQADQPGPELAFRASGVKRRTMWRSSQPGVCRRSSDSARILTKLSRVAAGSALFRLIFRLIRNISNSPCKPSKT